MNNNPVSITSLEAQNIKRVRAVRIELNEKGLFVIGGKNNQGKTSILDAIAFALGGKKHQPTNAKNDDAVSDPYIRIELSNGLVVTRRGKNSDLQIEDPSGKKAGQALLDSFISELAIDLPKFLQQPPKEKAKTLLGILGIESELVALDAEEQALYNRRHAQGIVSDQKAKYANELPEYTDAPEELQSVSLLIEEQQKILAQNGINKDRRDRCAKILEGIESRERTLRDMDARMDLIRKELLELNAEHAFAIAKVAEATDIPTDKIESTVAQYESINAQVRANLEKARAKEEAETEKDKYELLSKEIDYVRQRRIGLLSLAKLPIPGLSLENGEILYNGKAWDCLSSSEALRISVAIVRALKPSCGFVLLDKLEQMDIETLNDFAKWCEAENLQVIATRVSSGEECSIIIEDGMEEGKSYLETVRPIEKEKEKKENDDKLSWD